MKTEKDIIEELIKNQTEALIEMGIKERYLTGKIISGKNRQEMELALGKLQAIMKTGEDFLNFLKRQ